jgi:hypothetical protein
MLSRRVGDLEGLSASVTLFGLAIVRSWTTNGWPTQQPHRRPRTRLCVVVSKLLHRNNIGEQLCEVTDIYINSLDVMRRSSCAGGQATYVSPSAQAQAQAPLSTASFNRQGRTGAQRSERAGENDYGTRSSVCGGGSMHTARPVYQNGQDAVRSRRCRTQCTLGMAYGEVRSCRTHGAVYLAWCACS